MKARPWRRGGHGWRGGPWNGGGNGRIQAARAALAGHAHGFPGARDLLYETLVVVVHDAAPAARGAVAVVRVVLLNRFPCNGTQNDGIMQKICLTSLPHRLIINISDWPFYRLISLKNILSRIKNMQHYRTVNNLVSFDCGLCRDSENVLFFADCFRVGSA